MLSFDLNRQIRYPPYWPIKSALRVRYGFCPPPSFNNAGRSWYLQDISNNGLQNQSKWRISDFVYKEYGLCRTVAYSCSVGVSCSFSQTKLASSTFTATPGVTFLLIRSESSSSLTRNALIRFTDTVNYNSTGTMVSKDEEEYQS